MLPDLPKHADSWAGYAVHRAPGSQFTHTKGTAELSGLILEVISSDKGHRRLNHRAALLGWLEVKS